MDEGAEDGLHLIDYRVLIATGDVGDALQCGLEDWLLIDLHEAVADHLPVPVEVLPEELALEADACSTD